ncbi:MAG: HAMP domain-containing protein [Leptospirales bacterium]|nr:HAMP domain-containing protein [Leptospirales bacterium]
MRSLIQFKNAHPLRLDPGLSELIEGPLPPRLGLECVQQWKLEGFHSVFLLVDTESDSETEDNISKLMRLCRGPGIRLERLSLQSLRDGEHSAIQNHCRRLQAALREGACRLLFSSDVEAYAALLAASFLLTLRSMRGLSPQQAGEYILRSAAPRDLLRLIQEFKHYLDPGYRLPPEDSQTTLPELPEEPQQKGPEEAFDDPRLSIGQSAEPAFASAPQNAPTDVPKPPEANPEHAAAEADATPHAATAPTPVAAAGAGAPPSSSSAAPAAGQAAAPGGAVKGDRAWKKGRFTIGVKLLTIITGLIIAALTTSIVLASIDFSNGMSRRIEENNITVASVVGQRVESEIRNMAYKSHVMALTLEQNIGTPAQQALLASLFFKNNPDFVYLAVADAAGERLRLRRQLPNSEYLNTSGLSAAQVIEVIQSNAPRFARSFGGGIAVVNASQGSIPLLGIGIPLGQSAAILIVDPAQILKAFQIEGNTLLTTYMVGGDGELIAHTDSNQVLAHANRVDSPIVQRMFAPDNRVSTGVLPYVDTDHKSYLGAFARLGVGGLGIVSAADEEQAFAAVAQIQRKNLLILIITLAISFLIVYFFSKTLTVPIVDLVGATRKIEAGDYQVDIEAITGDEIGSLTHSFRSMAVGLQEREKVKDALSRFANKKVAEMALSGELKLGGETKDAAIFFSDLRGFTAMSEKMTPEEVVAYLNEYFTGMVACVNQTGGEVDKFIGDAVMAHWGAIDSTGNDTEHAINAALMMRRALIEFNKRGEGKRPFAKMGCGINTGPVVAGQLGSSEKMSYTVIGDAVNLASRIEALNKPFGTDILISQDSFERVSGIFRVEEQPAIKVKGKTEPQIIYAVIGRADDPQCPADMDAVRAMLGIQFDKGKAVDPDAKEEKFEVLGAAG